MKFVLQRHWWRGQIVIRFGPSSQHWDLRIEEQPDKFWHLVMNGDPRRGVVAGYEKPMRNRYVTTADGKKVDVMSLRGRVRLKPGTPANPTKETPAFLETIDYGTAEWLERQKDIAKLALKGKQRTYVLFMRREAPDSPFWEVSPSEGPSLEKGVRQLFGSPGGKRDLAHLITKLIPDHKVYVEPFAGGAAVFFAKPRESSAIEVLADRDPDIAFAYKQVQCLTDQEIEELEAKDWSIEAFEQVRKMGADSKLDRLYKWLYLRKLSYGNLSETPDKARPKFYSAKPNFRKVRERLQGVKIYCADWWTVAKRFDSRETFFFLDPPYPGTNRGAARPDLRWSWDDLEQMIEKIQTLKGKWILTLKDEPRVRKLVQKFQVRRVRLGSPMDSGGHESTAPKKRYELIVTNFPLPKNIRKQWIAELIKADQEKQLVYGVVLRPDRFDSQGDLAPEEEIEKAAHRFMEKSRLIDWKHIKTLDHNKAVPVESYIAPQDLRINGRVVPKGSWILVTHVKDPDLWQAIKKGEIRSYSIRGFGVRVPVD